MTCPNSVAFLLQSALDLGCACSVENQCCDSWTGSLALGAAASPREQRDGPVCPRGGGHSSFSSLHHGVVLGVIVPDSSACLIRDSQLG